MELCSRLGISCIFASYSGRLLAIVQSLNAKNKKSNNAKQSVRSDQLSKLEMARYIVREKLKISCSNLKRAYYRHAESNQRSELGRSIMQMETIEAQLQNAQSIDVLRGMEGVAAKVYFSCFYHLILPSQRELFRWKGRNRNPPRDPINAVLSFLYTLASNEVILLCRLKDVDLSIGFLHCRSRSEINLALDILELWRPKVDRIALNLINRKQLNENCFSIEPEKTLLNLRGRQIVAHGYRQILDGEKGVTMINHVFQLIDKISNGLETNFEDVSPLL
jgi:CRISPR-associated protein Cas1